MRKLCVIDVVGLTPRHVGPATPNLARLAASTPARPLAGVVPAVTCSAQATLLTGQPPSGHGIVGNGWLYRDTMEVRFWQQSNRLLQAEPLYVTARARAAARGEVFTCAKLFWWFNQGAAVDWSLTPKPHYGSDGSKVFGVHGSPEGFAERAERALGKFPFHTFWGPMAGLPCSEWIARSAAWTLREHAPTLTLVYLPHLDYDLQRFGPDLEELDARLAEVDACVGTILEAADATDTQVAVVSEYGLLPVTAPILLNQHLRHLDLLVVRDGPFGEMLDTHLSPAFAVVDHQVAHVYVRDAERVEEVRTSVAELPGVASTHVGVERRGLGLDHERAGEIVALARPDHWFAYPYWLDDRRAPDFARSVDIHRKPGYDPAELFFDPHTPAPKLKAGLRLLQTKLGLRTRFDVIGLDPTIVRGSHGVPPVDAHDGPVWIGPGEPRAMEDVKETVLSALGLPA